MKFPLKSEMCVYLTIQGLNVAQDSSQVLTNGSKRPYASKYNTQLLQLLQTKGCCYAFNLKAVPQKYSCLFPYSTSSPHAVLKLHLTCPPCPVISWTCTCFNGSLRSQRAGLGNSRIWILNMRG